ncbi:DUF4160 domain-containing protein [Agrobacterium tumefaciens]|nr:DUF4160 domain-containing protein [Agrobacterium tumefaciens]
MLLKQLSKKAAIQPTSFKNPACWVMVFMVALLRQHGMRFVIYTADHEPPHAHVYGEGEARIDLVSLGVLTQGGMSDRDVRRAVAVIEENRMLFVQTWRQYHG